MPAQQHEWLHWVRKLQAIAQSGLTFAEHPYAIERYEAVRQIAAEIMAAHSQYEQEAILELFASELGYATPKLDVRGVVFQNDQILLVREASDGLWTLPGGWADINDSPSEAVTREIFEESGYETKAVKLLALYDKLKHDHPPQIPHAYKAFFLCEIISGTSTPSIETTEVAFFDEDKIPALSLHRVVLSQIHRLFEHHRQPDLPTDFD